MNAAAADTWKRVADLLPGDMIDLQGDKFADNGNHPELEFEFFTVHETEHETPACVCLYGENFACGFPPDHLVKFGGHLEGFDA